MGVELNSSTGLKMMRAPGTPYKQIYSRYTQKQKDFLSIAGKLIRHTQPAVKPINSSVA